MDTKSTAAGALRVGPGRTYPDRRRPGETVRDLAPMAWLRKVGTVHARQVCQQAGTDYAHFKHLAHGRRRASVDLALRLHQASGGGLSMRALMGLVERADGSWARTPVRKASNGRRRRSEPATA